MIAGLSSLAWSHLASAQKRLLQLGYLDIPCPWHAALDSIQITLPEGATPTTAKTAARELVLVGSAEQALIDLALHDLIPEGQPICCITPCFRLDDEGPRHHPYFMKLELGCFWRSSPPPFKHILEQAQTFQDHARILHLLELAHEPIQGPAQPQTIRTHHGWLRDVPLPDLQINGIEVGSYGARSWTSSNSDRFLSWAYGTGLAMPRALEAITGSLPRV